MDPKVISRNIGIALLLNALFMYISAGVSAFYDFDASFTPLIISAFITSLAGGFPLIFVNKYYDINLREGYTIVVLAWVISCLFGMLPYVMFGGELSIVDSWFESVSGYTTTGATVIADVEKLPKGILFWRSSTHWLGGLGVVVFMLLILPTVSSFRMKLSKMEISSLSRDNFRYKVKQTIRIISSVYFGLTLAEIILLHIAGMSLFDAVNHSFATIATGGFSTKNLSIASFDSIAIEIIIMVFMLLSGIHFGLLFTAISGKSTSLFKSPIVRYYLGSIIIGALIVSANNKFSGVYDSWPTALREGFFQVISIGTTTGFANGDSSVWPGFSILILFFFTIQCACSGSTSGGMKVDRVVIFFKATKAQILKQIHPSAVVPIKLGSHNVDKETVYNVGLFIILYLFLFFLTAVFVTLAGTPLLESFSSAAACIGNVGPGFGTVGSLGNYAGIQEMGKIFLTFAMLLGRLEIYSIILMFVVFRSR
jgi:trk system potassium uptake protein TrkH